MNEIEEIIEENKNLKSMLAQLSKQKAKDIIRLSNMIDARDAALRKIAEIMKRPASNRQFMQIADPARQVINITKGFIKP